MTVEGLGDLEAGIELDGHVRAVGLGHVDLIDRAFGIGLGALCSDRWWTNRS